ncbi:hypothetical protein LQW54_011276 [Pestalotiopsis sp. IQ-011]
MSSPSTPQAPPKGNGQALVPSTSRAQIRFGEPSQMQQGLVPVDRPAFAPATPHSQVRFGEPSQMQSAQSRAVTWGRRVFGFFNKAPPMQQASISNPQPSAVTQSNPNVQHGYAYVPTVAEVTNDGVVLYRPTAQPTFVSHPHERAVVQQDDQAAIVRHGEAEPPFGTRVANHLPLGPEDGPGRYGCTHRRSFRLMLDAANKLDTLYPDLEYAKSINWTAKVSALERQIYHWRSDIAGRLAKSQHSPVFQQLLLTYPQVHKHVASSFLRQRLAAPPAAAPAATPATAPAGAVKSEAAQDSTGSPSIEFFKQEDADRLASFHSSNQPVPSSAHSGQSIKREEPSTHEVLADISLVPQHTSSTTAHARHNAAPSSNADVEAADSDDCVIIAVRKVRARPAGSATQRANARRDREIAREAEFQERKEGMTVPGASYPSLEHEPRSILTRTGERAWSTEPQTDRSPSPQARRQVYRERSPRRDAIVEELLDLEDNYHATSE